MDDNIKPEEWIDAKQAFRPQVNPPVPPKVDKEVSKIVGHEVFVNDPRLIKEVLKWREASNPDKMDNYLQDPAKRADLRRVLGDRRIV